MTTANGSKHDDALAQLIPGWERAVEYLLTNDYIEVVEILRKRQTAASARGEARLVALLEAAVQICEACVQHQSQVELHSQAMTQSLQRQQQLQQQMLAFLTSTMQSNTAVHRQTNPENGSSKRPLPHSEPANNVSLWQPPQPAALPVQPAEKPGSKSLSVYFLGAFRVFANGRFINNWSGNKGKSIFKHMIMNRHRAVNHEVLMDLFWPEEEPELARRNLYQAVYLLRQALQQDGSDFQFIICQDGAYSFNAELDIWVDCTIFEDQYTHGLQLEKEGELETAVQAFIAADELYSGDFLAEDIYEEWTVVYRERLKHAHLDLLDRISQHYWTIRQYGQCITYCKKILQGDSCREDIHRRLMLAYQNQGQRHLAIRQYHRCVETLSRELDVEPLPATTQLFHQIMNGEPQTI